MNEKKSVIIIGAGIGGIATSLFLARKGYSVEVYEKNGSPGGRCGQITREGYRFDLGATMMLMPDVYREVFQSMGLELESELKVKPLDDIYTVYFSDGSSLPFTTDRKRMAEHLEKMEEGGSAMAERYVTTGHRLYKMAFDKLIGRNFTKFFQFFKPGNVILLLRLKALTNHFSYTRRFFRSPHLQMAYTFQNIYVGQSPFDAPALFSMIPSAELTEGSLFPEGGMHRVVTRLAETASSMGVKFIYNAPAVKFNTEGRKVTSVTFSDGTVRKADIIVANADLPYVYRELLPRRFKTWRIEKMRYSCGALVLHWAVDKHYPQLGHHSVFLTDGFREGLDMIFRKKSMGDDPSFYIHSPVRTDPGAAPEGCDALSVIVGVGHADPGNPQDWEAIKDKARRAVFERLKLMGIDDLENHIRFEIAAAPPAWEQALNVTRGSVFGSLSHNIFQMGYFRPHNRDGRYRNLYFTGGSTHPGNGIPMVLLSARLVSERILEEQKQL